MFKINVYTTFSNDFDFDLIWFEITFENGDFDLIWNNFFENDFDLIWNHFFRDFLIVWALGGFYTGKYFFQILTVL